MESDRIFCPNLNKGYASIVREEERQPQFTPARPFMEGSAFASTLSSNPRQEGSRRKLGAT